MLVQNLSELQTLPSVLLKIIETINNPKSSASDLVTAVSSDQATTSLLLKLVNSAFYGHLRKIGSMQQAIVILGFQTVKTMAMSVSIFKPPEGIKSVFDHKRFWIHSIGVATISQRLFDRCRARH